MRKANLKKMFLVSGLLQLLISCSTYTDITGSWSTSRKSGKLFRTVLIVSLTPHAVLKATLENDLARQLEKKGLTAVKGIEEFPPGLEKDTIDKENLAKKIKEKSIDALLTVSLIRKENDTRCGNCSYTPMIFGYYGNFWGYYSYWYPCVYNPAYYSATEVYYVETNLYDAETKDLLWSAQSVTYAPDKLSRFSRDLSTIVVKKLKQDGIIQPVHLAKK